MDMVFRCKKCFRPIKTMDAHGRRGSTCKEVPLKRCIFCNSLEDHVEGKQGVCQSSRAGGNQHVFEKVGLVPRKVA